MKIRLVEAELFNADKETETTKFKSLFAILRYRLKYSNLYKMYIEMPL